MSGNAPPMERHQPQVRSEADVRHIALNAGKLTPRDGSSVDTSYLAVLLSDIVYTANSSSISLAHRGAACNLLSTLLSNINGHASEAVRALVWQNDTWIISFKFVISHFSDSKPKPMKQLLGTLIAVIQKCRNDPTAQPSLKWLVATLSGVFENNFGSAPPKGYLYAFTLALTKRVLCLDDIESNRRRGGVAATSESTTNADLISAILSWTAHDELGPTLSSLVTAILQTGNQADLSLWHVPLISNFSTNAIVQSCYRHYILPALFAKDAAALATFLHALDLETCFDASANNELRAELAISTLLIASSAQLVTIETSTKTTQPSLQDQRIVLPLAWLSLLLTSQSSVARLGSLTILVGDSSTTEPFSPEVLKLFAEKLPLLFADTDADFRSDLLSQIQRMIERLRASAAAMHKKQDERLIDLKKFLSQWSTTLQAQLRPSASYQRHACALQCIKMLIRSGIDDTVPSTHWSKAAKSYHSGFHMTLFDSATRMILLTMLMNPFDDIRGLAMSSLQAIGPSGKGHAEGLQTMADLVPALEAQFSSSGRADHADGVARAYALLYSVASSEQPGYDDLWYASKAGVLDHLLTIYEGSLSAAASNMTSALQSQLLHSTIISLRYIIELDQSADALQTGYFAPLLSAVEQTWVVVRHVLCNDAPEGFVLDEGEEKDADMDSKSILSFCWRALKEASLLQRAVFTRIATSKPASPETLPVLQHQLNLCFTQLIELRHRGAFSTVAQTFLACCNLFAKRYPEDDATISQFYQRVISSIRHASTINTRRSAGLPAALAGILCSTESAAAFSTAVADLTAIANENATFPIRDHQALPQVHALNCLRELFKHSKLGQRSEIYIPQCLLLAGRCLTSDLWGIRNSGLMLFRSLIDRLLGTNDSYEDDVARSKAKDLMSRFPELLDLVMGLLDVDASLDATASVEKVFPALQLLQRVKPPVEQLVNVCNAVAKLTGSAHWHVRDKAAQAFAQLQSIEGLTKVFEACASWTVATENARHGQMLCLRYMLKHPESWDAETTGRLVSCADQVLQQCYEQSCSEVVLSVAIEITTIARKAASLQMQSISPGDDGLISNLVEARLLESSQQSGHPGSLLTQALANTLLIPSNGISAEALSNMILSLASSDIDACVALLERATAASGALTSECRGGLAAAVVQILTRDGLASTVHIMKAAITLLAAIIDIAPRIRSVTHDNALTIDRVLSFTQSPLLHDAALVLAGSLIDQALTAGTDEFATRTATQHWVALLCLASEDERPFDTRFAAATALSKLKNGITSLLTDPESSSLAIDLATITYDLTNDDDDEVRDLAALTANRLFATDVLPATVPLAAGASLLQRLLFAHRGDAHLFGHAISKLTDNFLPVALPAQDPTLFAREKQNLFLDPAREAKVFSRLALRLAPAAVHQDGLTRLRDWTLAGIATLSSSLGRPTFTSDIFVLVIKIIYAAEVVFVLKRKHGFKGIDTAGVRMGLVSMVSGLEGGHPALLEEGKRVLCDELLSGAELVGARLGTVPMP